MPASASAASMAMSLVLGQGDSGGPPLRRHRSENEPSSHSSSTPGEEPVKFWLGNGYSTSSSGASAKSREAAQQLAEGAGAETQELHSELGPPLEGLRARDAGALLQQVPRSVEGELLSVGSAQHEAGTCSPCVFWTRKCCTKGVHCSYCHYPHEARVFRARPATQGQRPRGPARTKVSL
mmetsp:Transcript_114908/g.359485  ORF Transcript_114908/g.359485 Transcript_114908/m.359485 type:complete len:180 (+) Transcript_114908:50-589(+)